jgi:hypothetical protein
MATAPIKGQGVVWACRMASIVFFTFIYCMPKNQVTNNKVSPPAKILSAPSWRAFCSGVQSRFQCLFTVSPFFHQDHGIQQYTYCKNRGHHTHVSCILWCFCRPG